LTPVILSANWYFDERLFISLAVSLSKPYCSNGVVDPASGTSVPAMEERSAVVDERIPPDQEAVGEMLLLIKVVRPAKESSMLVGSLAHILVRAVPEWGIGTQGAISSCQLYPRL
jgi:hypothetical protein